MIAITFALPAESFGLWRRLRNKINQRAGIATIGGQIDHQEVEIVHTGVGKKLCATRIDNFLRAAQPRYLIAAGFAGAVREDLQAGDLVFAENFSDRELLARAQRVLAGQTIHVGKLVTMPRMIDSVAERQEIGRTHGAMAVDMETETIAQACAERGLPLLSLRVISDTPREPFPAPPDVLFDIARQKTNFAKLSGYLMKHPAALPRLIGFARRIARAREALTDAIVALLRDGEL